MRRFAAGLAIIEKFLVYFTMSFRVLFERIARRRSW
jgi:hypothetical protein